MLLSRVFSNTPATQLNQFFESVLNPRVTSWRAQTGRAHQSLGPPYSGMMAESGFGPWNRNPLQPAIREGKDDTRCCALLAIACCVLRAALQVRAAGAAPGKRREEALRVRQVQSSARVECEARLMFTGCLRARGYRLEARVCARVK